MKPDKILTHLNCLTFGLLLTAGLCTGFLVSNAAAATRQEINLNGVWQSNVGREYEITQRGNQFTWKVLGTNETGSGAFDGLEISSSWQGEGRKGSANGKILLDPQGRAHIIEWENGVVFRRSFDEAQTYDYEAQQPRKDFVVEGRVIQPDRKEDVREDPSKADLPFVYDFKVLQKTAYSALLEVSYKYNPPTGSQPKIMTKVYANGIEVGGGWAWTPVEFSTNGKALIPVGLVLPFVLSGSLAGQGNWSEEIEFILTEEGKQQQLKIDYPFSYVWGDDSLALLRATVSPSQYADKKKVEFIFYYSLDPRRLSEDRNNYSVSHASVSILATPFFQGKAANYTITKEIVKITNKAALSANYIGNVPVEYHTGNPQCDEVRVVLQYYHAGIKKDFWRENFKVTLINKP
jgi:hypothetical protein